MNIYFNYLLNFTALHGKAHVQSHMTTQNHAKNEKMHGKESKTA